MKLVFSNGNGYDLNSMTLYSIYDRETENSKVHESVYRINLSISDKNVTKLISNIEADFNNPKLMKDAKIAIKKSSCVFPFKFGTLISMNVTINPNLRSIELMVNRYTE